MTKWLALLLVFFSSAMGAMGCAGHHLREDRWIVAKSQRFEIYSTLRPESARALATELERFHALIYAVTSAPRVESPIPTRIFALRRSQYSQFGPARSAGVMQPGLRNNVIVISDYSPTLGASQIILHEYVHFVLRNGRNRAYPIWYDEGLAELFSAVRRHENLLAIGAIPKSRISSFEHGDWLPMERVVAARSYEDVDMDDVHMLYAESWALVHYLMLDRPPGSPDFAHALAQYLDVVEAGRSTDDAYRTAFGEPPGRSGQKIKDLLESGQMNVIGVPIAKLDFDRSEPTVRTPDLDEIAIRLGRLHLGSGDAKKAEQEFRAAIDHDPDEPRAHAGLGDALKYQDRLDEAEPCFHRAVELGPEDPLNHLDLAEFYHERAVDVADSLESLRADLEKARGHYRDALGLAPELPETLVMLGVTHLAAGEQPHLAIGHLKKAFEVLPASTAVLGYLAEAHLAIGDEDSARRFLVRLNAARGEGGRRFSVDEEIAQIRKRRDEASKRVGLSVASASGA